MDSAAKLQNGMNEVTDNPVELVSTLDGELDHNGLTKMMRGDDAQDMEDVAFLVRHDGITLEQMEPAFSNVRMPDIQELRDAFERALPRVRAILQGRV